MKKSNKILLILSIICIVVGLGIAGCGIVNGIFQSMSPDKEIVTQEIEEPFENLMITVPYADISISTNESSAKVKYPKSMQKDLTIASASGKLTVSESTDWASIFKLNMFWHKDKVTVILPATWAGDIEVNGRSGDVSVSGLQTEKTLNINTSSGNIQVEGCMLSSLNVTQRSGNIKIDSSNIQNSVSIQGRSGNLLINNSDCKTGNLEIRSGDVKLSSFTASEILKITTHSGNINLTKVDSPSLALHSDSGSVSGSIASEKIFTVATNSGDVNVPPSNGNETCEITTKSGDINLKINNI